MDPMAFPTKELLLSLAFAGEEPRGLALGQKCCLSDRELFLKGPMY